MSDSVRLELWHAGDSADAAARLLTTRATHVAWAEDYGRPTPAALSAAEAVLDRFDVDLLYGDSVRSGLPFIAPTFSPLRLREQNYLGSLVVMSTEWMRSVGGFDPRVQGAHGYDFALRYQGGPDRVVRVPEQLSVIDGEPARESEWAALERRLSSAGVHAELLTRANGTRRVRYDPLPNPLVSVVIPTRGSTAEIRGIQVPVVVGAVRSLIEATDYPELEIIVVADDSTPQAVIDEVLAIGGSRLRLVRFSEPFNFSAKINRGAACASGEYLLLLNDDTEVIDHDWLTTLVGIVEQPGVGMAGALLFFEDGSVQHGGHLYREGWAGHIESPSELGNSDALDSFTVTREVSGVTAACALVSSDTFWSIGGMSLDFPGNYNDVDFSLKVRSIGQSVVFSPDARLFHFESKSRDATVHESEIAALRQRWGSRLVSEMYWSEGAPVGKGRRRATR